jgi:COP9 signalosome complex subunit 2
MSDDEEYEFEYSDAEDEMQADDFTVKAENAYYNAKGNVSSGDDGAARSGFQEVLDLETEAGGSELADWGFKASKQLVKLCYRTKAYADMLKHYRSVLSRINAGAVTRNRAEKSINRILDLVSGASAGSSAASANSATAAQQSEQLAEFYKVTLDALTGPGNERLAFKTRTKLARVYLRAGDWKRLRPLLTQLLEACGAGANSSSAALSPSAQILASTDPGADDRSKGTQLLEVFALQMEMYSELRDNKRLTELFHRATAVRTAVAHPSTVGVIHECGGKMYMRDRAWDRARLEFLEAFKGYEEAGATTKTVQCLRYLLLANMLSDSRCVSLLLL